jgi:hypothetical protein
VGGSLRVGYQADCENGKEQKGDGKGRRDAHVFFVGLGLSFLDSIVTTSEVRGVFAEGWRLSKFRCGCEVVSVPSVCTSNQDPYFVEEDSSFCCRDFRQPEKLQRH